MMSVKCTRFAHKASICHLALIACLPLALLALVTSCCPPIWSGMKKRAQSELPVNASHQNLLISDNFRNASQNWIPEAENGYTLSYSSADSSLDVQTSQGFTLWFKKALEDPVQIKLEAFVVDQGDSLDRINDLTCFWMASDLYYPDSLFARMDFRKGAFSRYYCLQLYSMTIGGNSGLSTHFSRYDGRYEAYHNEMKRPENIVEFRDEAYMLIPNHWFKIEISVQQGRVRYIQDGRVLVDYLDPDPLKKGWFGIRTAQNHIRIRNFSVCKL